MTSVSYSPLFMLIFLGLLAGALIAYERWARRTGHATIKEVLMSPTSEKGRNAAIGAVAFMFLFLAMVLLRRP